MADFEIGQIFLDKKATNHQGTKGKYYISLSDAEYDDDEIICFVFNTENHMYKYKYGCNKEDQKYILKSNSFTFLKKRFFYYVK